MRVYFFIIFLILTGLNGVLAQSVQVLSNLSPSIKWQQINTAHFRVLYPQGFSAQGQRMANTLEHIYAPVSVSLGREPLRRTDFILQNQESVANGFVTLGPRRSEFYTTTPQKPSLLGNNDWLSMLALHEYRHVVQYDRSRTGFTNLVYYIFGQNTQNAVASGSVPSWFWEGDAVGIETAMSKSGRGRIPEFSREFRANLLEKGPFNYSKQYLRSFKDYIPNHYVLGYHFNTYLRTKYGAEAVEHMIARTWNVAFIPFWYSFSMRKATGKKMPANYRDMMADLKEQWTAQLAKETLTDFQTINYRKKKVFTNYDYPQILDDGNIVVLKSGLADIPKITLIDVESGKEKTLFTPGPINSAEMLSVSGSTIVWNEFEYDPRWLRNSYSVIKTYNVATKQQNTYTSKSRYSAAALSPDRSKIATIEMPDDYSCSLVVLDAFNGKPLRKISSETNTFYSMPRWGEDNRQVVVMKTDNGVKSIEIIDTETGIVELVLPPGEEQISNPVLSGGFVYYSSAYSGIDNIYAVNVADKSRYRITSSKYGAYSPVVGADGSSIYYNEYTVAGTDVVKIDLNKSTWQPLAEVVDTDIHYYEPLIEQENNSAILDNVPDSIYQETRYKKKFINVHSWGPIFTGDLNSFEIGMFSRNVLSTTDLFFGYEFDNQGNGNGILRLSYQGLYPILDLTTTYGFRRADIQYTDTTGAVLTDRRNWNEWVVKFGPRIPWKLTNSKYHRSMEILNYVGFTNVSNYTSTRSGEGRGYSFNQLTNGNLYQNEFKIILSNQLKRSKRDIYSRWGQLFIFENFSTPYGGSFKGGLTAIRAQLYFPGFARHHSINFLAGYQHQQITLDENEYWFNNRMPFPRGYPASVFENFYTVRSNYALPILYPDLHIGPWLNIQRIKAELFYDYGYGELDVTNTDRNLQAKFDHLYGSTGIDLTFDINVMRALPLIELGVRFVYIPEYESTQFEFLVGSFGF